MNYIKYISLFSVALLLVNCNKEITLENPNKEQVLVVNGYLSPDQGAIVDVSHSILDITTDSITSIQDAKVSLYENDVYMGDLKYSENINTPNIKRAYYNNPDIPIKEDQNYRLEVEHSDYDNITAITKVPKLSIATPKLEYVGEVDENKSRLKLTLEESNLGENFYGLVVKEKTKLYEVVDGDTLEIPGFGGENIGFVDFKKIGLSDLVTTGLEIYNTYADFAVHAIDNSFFLNSKMDLTFDIYKLNTTLLENQFLVQEVKVEVRQLSKDYFEYTKTLSIQEKIADDPFASEVIVYNNIDGGLGNFSGYQVIESNVVRI